MTATLMILGAGGHGKAVAEAAMLSREWDEVVFLDDAWPDVQLALGLPVIGKLDSITSHIGRCHGAIAAVGNNALRSQWVSWIESAGVPLATVVHPRAWVSPSAEVGEGCVVMAGAVLGTSSVLGKAVIVNANATVDHDVSLGDLAHLGVGVQLAGGVKVGAMSWLQAGCSAGYDVVVAPHSDIGPGNALR